MWDCLEVQGRHLELAPCPLAGLSSAQKMHFYPCNAPGMQPYPQLPFPDSFPRLSLHPLAAGSRFGWKIPFANLTCAHLCVFEVDSTLSLSLRVLLSPRFAAAPKSVDGHGFTAKPGAGRSLQPSQPPSDIIPQSGSGSTFQNIFPPPAGS